VLSAAGLIAMLLALAGSVYPMPTGAYAWLPYVYLVYLLAGFGWYVVNSAGDKQASEKQVPSP